MKRNIWVTYKRKLKKKLSVSAREHSLEKMVFFVQYGKSCKKVTYGWYQYTRTDHIKVVGVLKSPKTKLSTSYFYNCTWLLDYDFVKNTWKSNFKTERIRKKNLKVNTKSIYRGIKYNELYSITVLVYLWNHGPVSNPRRRG